MTTATTEKKSAQDRAREDLAAAIARLRTEDGWKAWLLAKSRMYSYSFNNQLLIWTQCPDATVVRGKKQWKQHFNRFVKFGTKPIWILAPRTKKLDEIDPQTGKEKVITYFRGVKVYDVAATEQIPGEPEIPLRPPSQPITGDTHIDWIGPLVAHAHELGITVRFAPIAGSAQGYFDREAKTIVVDEQLPANGQVHVLVHEIAHAHGITYEEGRDHAEACTEAAAYLACTAIGLDTAGETVPYIAGWHDEAEDVIARDAQRIDRIAKAISSCRDPEPIAA